MLIPLLLAGIGVIVVVFGYAWWRSYRRGHPHAVPSPLQLGLGAVTLFFDTLGIGNYAPTTAAFRFLRMVDDPLIPGPSSITRKVALR